MFENTLKTLEQLSGEHIYYIPIPTDDNGYFDKECPNAKCKNKFKVNAEDWKDKFSDDAVYCPYCGFEKPARFWDATEQLEQVKKQAVNNVKVQLKRAMKKDVEQANKRLSNKGLITISLRFSESTRSVDLPIEVLEEMKQQITCENCNARYAVVGSSYYCPCCGFNSAKKTFNNSINKATTIISNLNNIRQSYSKDEAAEICSSLIEYFVSDLVTAFQGLCNCIYRQMPNANSKYFDTNVFQRLDGGSKLWKSLVGEGYEDWLTPSEYSKLKICFQQRHCLQHKNGIVDQQYIDRSGDYTYKVGQRLVINEGDVLEYADIVNKIGDKLKSFLD